jgi:hypothetical protein
MALVEIWALLWRVEIIGKSKAHHGSRNALPLVSTPWFVLTRIGYKASCQPLAVKQMLIKDPDRLAQ